MPNPPPAPPLISDTPLIKAGLHKPARDWLAALPEYKFLGPYALFDAGSYKTLLLNKYEGKLADPQNQMVKRTFWEIPDRLYLVSNQYVLLTQLTFYDRAVNNWVVVGVSVWNPWQPLNIAYEDVTGHRYYETQNGLYWNMLGGTVPWHYSPLPIPDTFVAPMPAPGMGSYITTLSTNDYTDLVGYVCFTQNANGTLNFRAEVTWTSTNEALLEFRFPVPILARGKSFLPTAFCPEQALTASVAPKPGDNTMSVLTTTAWTAGGGVHQFTFECNNIP